MFVKVKHLDLSHNGEPIVEVDTTEKKIITLFRGVEGMENYWEYTDVTPEVLQALGEDISAQLKTRLKV